MMDFDTFMAIENEMQRQREQRESVKDKDTPFRVEYRFKTGTTHWQYYETYEDALNAEPSKRCWYDPIGRASIEYPSSQQIQKRGPRGGWSRYKT
jgi:hypothetical protein